MSRDPEVTIGHPDGRRAVVRASSLPAWTRLGWQYPPPELAPPEITPAVIVALGDSELSAVADTPDLTQDLADGAGLRDARESEEDDGEPRHDDEDEREV